MEKHCTYHQMMLIFTYWALGTGLGGHGLTNPKSSLYYLSDLERLMNSSVALIHCGGNGNPEVADCQVYSNDPREVPGLHLFLYCSNLYPVNWRMLLWTLSEVWLAGILFSIQFTEKLLHIFSFSWFLPFVNHLTQPGCNRFLVFFYTIYLFDQMDSSCGMQDLHYAMRDLALKCTDSPVVAHELQSVWAQ